MRLNFFIFYQSDGFCAQGALYMHNLPFDISTVAITRLNQIQFVERTLIGLGVLLVLSLTVFDAIEDYSQNLSLQMLIGDVAYMIVLLAILIYLWRFMPYALSKQHDLLTYEAIKMHKDAQAWQRKSCEVVRGFNVLVNSQMNEWLLTKAEKEVAMLLLKGLSIKEIALIRESHQNTVRQQASAIYRKSGLASRSALSAFFLEDMLVITDPD
jgi:DNA-binding CsgD family transcriptional regulator